MIDEQRWNAVIERDAGWNGRFVYAVRTTGIYCRPTCPSRRPFRANVEFFETTGAAEAAGYRPCQRCHPQTDARVEAQLDLIVQVCRALEAHDDKPLTLAELSERFAISPFHLQRTFKRVVGVSPRQYADAVRQGRLKSFLKDESTVTDAIYAAGYGGSSRLYEQVDHALGMTPIHYRKGGETMNIRYTITPCRLGYLLVAATERGVCKISLGGSEAELLSDLGHEFPAAQIARDGEALALWVSALVEYTDGGRSTLDLPLDIQATGFQRRVWEALRTIPYGSTRSYQEVASMIGQPTAARAVASACAHNPVAMAIPCHRVVRQDGDLSGYRWGVERKRALLAREAGE
jgi:AraC family transcriptional regulator of adaptative response/methylated-DNA-[protein]-cysteine methyltransferase